MMTNSQTDSNNAEIMLEQSVVSNVINFSSNNNSKTHKNHTAINNFQ